VLEEGGGFAAGDDECVEVDKVVGLAHKRSDGTEFGEASGVNFEGALEREHADRDARVSQEYFPASVLRLRGRFEDAKRKAGHLCGDRP
jgi:hypothetical protein